MKKLLLAAMAVLAIAGQSLAQFKLSGQITGLHQPDTITLNVPFIYGQYRENNIRIPVNSRGQFSKIIPLKTQKFGVLMYRQTSVTVLLTPGKNLNLTLDTAARINAFGGTAATENKVLYQTNMETIPDFAQGDRGANPYGKLTVAQIEEKVIAPWLKLRDERIKLTRAATLPAPIKALICSEIKYNAYVQLSYFARGIMDADKDRINEVILSVYKNAQPGPDVFPAGPQYYYYAQSYIGYLDTKIFVKYPPRDERSQQAFMETYKMSLDSATKLVKLKGKAYINWYLLNLNFNRPVAEQYLAQAIWTQYHDKDISHILPLMADFKANFPHSKYLPFLQRKVDTLNMLYHKNEANNEIKIFAGYKNLQSIYPVINSLKGKVVLLDIWGTWCPACKTELRYNPQLKQYFKDKDVAYVYLDMDDDAADADWQKFIRINNMTGTHLRKSKADIAQFWNELQPDKNRRGYYPTYFIFDKNGKLVQVDAKYPGEGIALYKQIEQYL